MGRSHLRPFLISLHYCRLEQPSQVRAAPDGSQTAKSIKSNSCPVLFQTHHVAVAESAVIGYPHEIKTSPRAVALQQEVALVAMLCPHHTAC